MRIPPSVYTRLEALFRSPEEIISRPSALWAGMSAAEYVDAGHATWEAVAACYETVLLHGGLMPPPAAR